MKKLIMILFCLMTMILSTKSQISINRTKGFYDSLSIETPVCHNIISIKHIGDSSFELVRYIIGEDFFGNKTLEKSVLLYRGSIDSMMDFFGYILNKSKEWNEICIQNNSPWVNKKIIGCSVEINKKNKYNKQLKNWNSKYDVEFGYDGKGGFMVVFDKLMFRKCSFYKEKDLSCILEYIKSYKVKNYIKEVTERGKISQILQ